LQRRRRKVFNGVMIKRHLHLLCSLRKLSAFDVYVTHNGLFALFNDAVDSPIKIFCVQRGGKLVHQLCVTNIKFYNTKRCMEIFLRMGMALGFLIGKLIQCLYALIQAKLQL
jgi:hypothetical protein